MERKIEKLYKQLFIAIKKNRSVKVADLRIAINKLQKSANAVFYLYKGGALYKENEASPLELKSNGENVAESIQLYFLLGCNYNSKVRIFKSERKAKKTYSKFL